MYTALLDSQCLWPSFFRGLKRRLAVQPFAQRSSEQNDGARVPTGANSKRRYLQILANTIIILHPFDPCYADTINPTVTHGEHGEHRPLKRSSFYFVLHYCSDTLKILRRCLFANIFQQPL